MSTPSPLAKLALRRLADESTDVTKPTELESDAAVALIARELDGVRAQRRRRRLIGASLAIAAAIALVIGGARMLRAPHDGAVASDVTGGVLFTRGADGATLTRGVAVEKGDRIVASAAGSATLQLRRGTELRANAGADVVIADYGAAEIFDLRAGAIDLQVAKLASGERFVVRTADAEVEVRGTRFRVEITERCNGTTTRVKVTEGLVVVRHAGSETSVHASESWPAECVASLSMSTTPALASVAVPVPIESPPLVPTQRSTAPTKLASAAPPAPTVSPTPMPSSELAEQNRLYADAMAAKRRGDSPSALASLERLLATHPTGPLAESASVERMRILAASDPTRGAEAARAYLARYPNGHARDEARKLAGAP